jgi:hypothetical protein
MILSSDREPVCIFDSLFGCQDEPVGLFYLPGGCYCFADQLQYLCWHHLHKSAALKGIHEVFYWGA